MMNIDSFSQFINRSLELQSIMADVISDFEPAPHNRCLVSFQAGILSFEHHLAIFQLISDELYSPGFSLLRPQFENLVRGIWLLHAATDSWIEKFNQPLTEESAKKGDASPNLTEMIEHLKKIMRHHSISLSNSKGTKMLLGKHSIVIPMEVCTR